MKIKFLPTLFLGAAAALGQTTSTVGTVAAIRPEAMQVEIKSDKGDTLPYRIDAKTLVQRIPPGEKDLKKASAISITDVAIGDRVLVTSTPDSPAVRRILVMGANEIAKRQEADRLDWSARGVSGVVTEKKGNQVTLKMRSMTGETNATVTLNEKTSIKRYAPDSVRFADALASKPNEINIGDQVRARGEKSADGLAVSATEVVFGSFQTKAGTVTAVNAETGEVTLSELGTKATLVAKATKDSSLKAMPDFAAMFAGGGPPPGGMPGGGGMPPGGPPTGMGGRGPGGPPDMSQMLERMPAIQIKDLKPGQTVVVSSTKGSVADHLTIITLLANAEMLIRMASMQAGGQPGGGQRGGGGLPGGAMGMPGGMGMGGMMGGGLDLPGMTP